MLAVLLLPNAIVRLVVTWPLPNRGNTEGHRHLYLCNGGFPRTPLMAW